MARPAASAQAYSPVSRPSSRQAPINNSRRRTTAPRQFCFTWESSANRSIEPLRQAGNPNPCRHRPGIALAFAGETIACAAHGLHQVFVDLAERLAQAADVHIDGALLDVDVAAPDLVEQLAAGIGAFLVDRKSTRLNSSHSQISYAVFCLKKKKNKNVSGRSAANAQLHPRAHDATTIG